MIQHKPILTDAEMHALICGNPFTLGLSIARLKDFVRQVEKAVAAKLAEQEPVAWHTEDHLSDKPATTYDPEVVARWEYKGRPITPLYAHPGPDLEPDYYFYKGKLHCNDGGTHLNHGAKEYGRPLYDRSMPNSQGFLDSSEPKERPTIRCNDCWWHGNEDGLVLAVAKDYPDDEPTKVCPSCKKLGCLMDLDIPDAGKMITPLAQQKRSR